MRLRLFCNTTLVVLICTFLGIGLAYAQVSTSEQSPPVVQSSNTNRTNTPNKPSNGQEKKQSLNFEDELVEGSAQKPDFFYLFQKKNFNYKRLIRLRENFLPEMRRTAEDIQRLRGGR